MFTIDLLKGQGVPMKSRPEGIVIAAVTLAVPLLIAIAMGSFYLRNSVIIAIKNQDIKNFQMKIGRLADAVELQKTFEKEKTVNDGCLSEVKASINRHAQWSPVLEILARNMPESVVLEKIGVEQKSVKRSISQKNNSLKTVIVRTVHMSVYGSLQSNCGDAVREFRNRLWSSSLLGQKLENIRVSQKSARVENQDVISYEIDCVFKPEM
jgi:Tfp pilus assembly protein PilN